MHADCMVQTAHEFTLEWRTSLLVRRTMRQVDGLKFTTVKATECKVAGIAKTLWYVLIGSIKVDKLTYKYIRTNLDGHPILYHDRDDANCSANNYVGEEIDLIEWELVAYTGENDG